MEGVRDQNTEVEGIESGLEADKFESSIKERTGNLWTASAHIITAVIGSGVLSLPWGMAQLGWIAGVTTLVVFSIVTLYTSNLLADCYRTPTGAPCHTYTQVIKNNFGKAMYGVCATVQYAILGGLLVGYTITASISIVAIEKSECFRIKGHEAVCRDSHNEYMIGMGIVEVFLSQIPNFDKLSFLSLFAAVMSLAYSSIGAGLAFAKLVSGQGGGTSLSGIEIGPGLSPSQKMWRVFTAFGDIAFAYSYSIILIEIQDTLKPTPPENVVMKRANAVSVATTTVFYMMCGCFGYAALGNHAPGNMLTGFYEPFWLVNVADACVVAHLVGAYQVCAQPIFKAVEQRSRRRFPKSKFINAEYSIGIGKHKLSINLFRLIWRTMFVALATLVSMILPFFNDILALLGAVGYWPLTVFFPIELYITTNKIPWHTWRWLGLQTINVACLLVAVIAGCGAIEGLSRGLSSYTPFQMKE
ncbi:amino acid permease 8-like [Salvia divinorum]|uniref:Amino acid permease 8-like n=1 Tax=Salvia divinorum TaxID=28513 RepID=A0ABD1H7H3_SALDI